MLWATPWEEWYAGRSVKILWARTDNGTFQDPLSIEGRRPDGPTLAINATIPCCYFSNYQASGLWVPTAGCWEVAGRVANLNLKFVVQVHPA